MNKGGEKRVRVVIIFILVFYVVFGGSATLETYDPPSNFQPPGKGLYARDSGGNLLPAAPEEPVEHPELR